MEMNYHLGEAGRGASYSSAQLVGCNRSVPVRRGVGFGYRERLSPIVVSKHTHVDALRHSCESRITIITLTKTFADSLSVRLAESNRAHIAYLRRATEFDRLDPSANGTAH